MKYIIALFLVFSCVFCQESISYGTPANGRLENGVKLPLKGENFVPYSILGSFLGRTYVNSNVRDIILESYDSLLLSCPDKIFMYGETGFKNGGSFKPHRTHMNGLAVDFMVPVLNDENKSVPLPTSVFNKFGYSIEFDENGKMDKYKIDFEAMGSHIVTTHKISKNKGFDIVMVIFDPKLQSLLFSTVYGEYLKKNIKFSKTQAWVRHDEHYHIIFDIPTKPL